NTPEAINLGVTTLGGAQKSMPVGPEIRSIVLNVSSGTGLIALTRSTTTPAMIAATIAVVVRVMRIDRLITLLTPENPPDNRLSPGVDSCFAAHESRTMDEDLRRLTY